MSTLAQAFRPIAVIDETASFPYSAPSGTTHINIINLNNTDNDLSMVVTRGDKTTITIPIPPSIAWNGGFNSIDSVTITGTAMSFKLEFGG